MIMIWRLLGLVLSICLSLFLWIMSPFDGDANKALIIFSSVAFLWIFETVHLSVTALCIPFLAVFFGLMSPQESLSSFSSPVIYLFLGGFALSAALQQQKLDQLFARWSFHLVGNRVGSVILLLIGITGFMSLWISNTACASIMIPLGISIIQALPDGQSSKSLQCFTILGIAYAANIGGIGTIIGSPPNAIAASRLGISFTDWMVGGLPLVLILLVAMVLGLYLLFRPDLKQHISRSENTQMNKQSLKIEYRQIILMVIFILTVCSWFFSRSIAAFFSIESSIDAMIAIACLIALVSSGSLSWKVFEKSANWGVLLLFGGGITLSKIMEKSGASEILGRILLGVLDPNYRFLNMLMILSFVIFLTELVSNTASAALLIPIFSSFASSLMLGEEGLVLGVAFAASCAFMMPVGTPPNSIAYSSGYVSSKQMMSAGFLLNIVFSLLISLYVFFFWMD